MKIALVGGTGDIGTGFAVRWAENHEIIIGSRKADKAQESARAVLEKLEQKGNVWGTDNGSAIAASDVVVLCVPFESLPLVTDGLKSSYASQLVVSPVVPMSYNGRFFQYSPPSEGSAALQAREQHLKADALLCGDDIEALDTVAALAREIRSLRPLKAGPLEASSLVESLTPMLLNAARKNKIRDAGIRIISEREEA